MRLITLLSTALLVAGCAMVGPDLKKPEAIVPDAWSDVDEALIVAESAEYREWWKNFNDPVLDNLIQKAYEQSLTLRITGLRVYEARAILGVVVGSLYLQGPRTSGSASKIEISENAEPISNLPPAVGSLVDTSLKGIRSVWMQPGSLISGAGFGGVWSLPTPTSWRPLPAMMIFWSRRQVR